MRVFLVIILFNYILLGCVSDVIYVYIEDGGGNDGGYKDVIDSGEVYSCCGVNAKLIDGRCKCDKGWMNCDGDWSNGCEKNIEVVDLDDMIYSDGTFEGQEDLGFGGIKVVDYQSNDYFICVLSKEGDVYCRRDLDGHRNLGPVEKMNLGGKAKMIGSSWYVMCVALTDGRLKCWGKYVGDGTDEVRNNPVEIKWLGGEIKKIEDTTTSCICILDNRGKVYCWGENESGECGVEPFIEHKPNKVYSPLEVKGLEEGVIDLYGFDGYGSYGSYNAFCAILRDRRVKCWGESQGYSLWTGEEISCGNLPDLYSIVLPPRLMEGANNIVEVEGNNSITCLLDIEGRIMAVGKDPCFYYRREACDYGSEQMKSGTCISCFSPPDSFYGYCAKPVYVEYLSDYRFKMIYCGRYGIGGLTVDGEIVDIYFYNYIYDGKLNGENYRGVVFRKWDFCKKVHSYIPLWEY